MTRNGRIFAIGPANDNYPPVLTRAQAAAMCSLTPAGFDVWVRKRIVPTAIDGTRRWSRDAILRALSGADVIGVDVTLDPYEQHKNEIREALEIDARNNARPRDRLVYFITDGAYIKIGVSENPELRMVELQTSHPATLSLLATTPGGHRLESKLHREFSQDRIRAGGEWFLSSDRLRAKIADYAASSAVEVAA